MPILRRIYYPADEEDFVRAWFWMHKWPHLYAHNPDFGDLKDFCEPVSETLHFGIYDDGELRGVAMLTRTAKGCCDFGLIVPKPTRTKAIVLALCELQRSYFEDLGFWHLRCETPADERFEPTRKLARLMGWTQKSETIFEMTLIDYLKESHVK